MQHRTPYKLLLQSNKQGSVAGGRTEQQIELLTQLCINNNIFEYLGLAKNSLRQICDKMTLMWADHPHANEINENQVYLILQGKAFEYLHNNNYALKSPLIDRQEYLMVRKLGVNDFFIVYYPQTKYSEQHDFRKYQMMIDKNTLVAKISGDSYRNILLPLIEDRWRKIVTFLKKVQMLQSIPQIMLYQLSKYLNYITFPQGTQIINRNIKNTYVYFIIKGEVQYRIYNQTSSRQSPSKNYQTIHTKPFKKTILKENEVFGIDAFNSDTYEEIQMSYSTETKVNSQFYQIDKRILAIVISSFNNILPRNNKIWSSVNLNDQILGQGYQTSDLALLNRNVEKIKTSEKRIRDIKLRFYNTSQRNRTTKGPNEIENQKKQQFETLQDFKYQSCHNFAQFKGNREKNKKFYETFNSKIKINNFPQLKQTERESTKGSKINNILISPYEQSQVRTEEPQRQTFTNGFHQPFKTILSKRRSDSTHISGGKQQSDIIRSYLERKLRNQMLKKAQLILERNMQKKIKEGSKIKRIFSLKNTAKRPIPQLTSKGKEVGEQLYDRMNKLSQNPLLSQIEGQRKKLQKQTIKLKQSQIKTAQSQLKKSEIKSKSKIEQQKKELIRIQNN